MEQQKLAEIEAVGPAMGLSPTTVETMKRWNAAYYQAYREIDVRPAENDEHGNEMGRKLQQLSHAHSMALFRLLGGEERVRRYTALAATHARGTLEEEVTRPPSDRSQLIVIRDNSSGPPPDTSRYDPLFR